MAGLEGQKKAMEGMMQIVEKADEISLEN